MSSIATLNVRVAPRRMLRPKDAAGYCELTLKEFEQTCPVAKVAFPGGQLRYDIQDLDRWLEGLKAGGSASDDEIVGRLG